jgi:acetyltransferase-like isoleucine patch superfamily enzyme
MPEAMTPSDAKRVLLDKCVRGEFVLTPRTVQPQANNMEIQDAGPTLGPAERKAPQRTEASRQASSCTHEISAESHNAVAENTDSKSLIRKGLNRILHLLCRFCPGGTTLRPFLHRIRGVRIGKNVWIGDDVYLDNEFPECIEINDGAMIELRATIIAHTHGAGRVIIGKNAFVGAGSIVVTTARRTLLIGEGSVIMASSLVNSSVAPYTLYGSDGAKPLAQITKPFTATTSYEEFMAALRPLPR